MGSVTQPSRKPRRRDLTQGSIPKAIFRLALPTMLGNLLQTTYSLVDLRFVSRLGKEAVAAVGLGGATLFFLWTAFMGVATAAAAMVSRAVGARRYRDADHFAAQALLFTAAVGTALMLAGMLWAPAILKILRAPSPAVVEQGVPYLRVMFMGVPLMGCSFVAAGILRGAGDAVTPLILGAVGTVLNISLDPVLIFGLLGVPALGVTGAALASIISQAVVFAAGLHILAGGRLHIHLKRKAFRPDPAVLGNLLRIGAPSSVQMALRAGMNLALTGLMNTFGTAAYAAFVVSARLQSLGFMPTFGLAAASAVLTGQNLGADKPRRAGRSVFTAAAYALLIMGSVGAAAYVFAPEIVAFFSGDDAASVVPLGTKFIRIAVFGHLSAAVGIVVSRSIAGAGDTLPPMLFTLLVLWGVQVPLAFILSKFTSLGALGVIWAHVAASVLLAACSTAYFLSGRWAKVRILRRGQDDGAAALLPDHEPD